MALSQLPPPVVADAVMLSVCRSAMEARILTYCVVVAVVSASIPTLLLVATADRAPKWLSNCSIKEAGAPTIWLPGDPAVAKGVILWTRAAEYAEPKASLQPVTSLDYRLRALWRGRK